MELVFLALGSNLGNRRQLMDSAISMINERCGIVKETSPFYETEPVGFDSDNLFLNACISIQTTMDPLELLTETQKIETELGRIRHDDGVYHSRTLDIDIIIYGNLIINEESLCIPHANFRERDFVLRPLNDIAPDLNDPVTKKSIQELLESL